MRTDLSAKILFLFALLTFLAAAGSATAGEIRTVAELKAFLSGDAHDETPFVMTGHVAAVEEDAILFDDTTDILRLECDETLRPQALTRTEIRGLSAVPSKSDQSPWLDPKEPWARVQSVTVLGHVPPVPPRPVRLTDLDDESHNFRTIVTEGTVVDAFTDEIDPRYQRLLLKDGETTVPVALKSPDAHVFAPFVLACVRITGRLSSSLGGFRKFPGPLVTLASANDIDILVPPPADAFDAPTLEQLLYVRPRSIARLGRRRLDGTVAAAWRGRHFLLIADDGRVANVTVAEPRVMPPPGIHVSVVGFPDTDFFRINLTCALWRADGQPPTEEIRPFPTTARQLLRDESDRPRILASFHGRLVKMPGTVRHIPEASADDLRLRLEDGGLPFSVDVSPHPEVLRGLVPGSRVAVTGVCLIESDAMPFPSTMPRLTGFSLVIRTPKDIVILSSPPWWTPTKLATALAALLMTCAAVFVWFRLLNRAIDRRGRELCRSQLQGVSATLKAKERTRLATELHDALSQNLSAIACQVATARGTSQAGSETRSLLATAERMLQSSRTELTNCLFDLRGNALDKANFAAALDSTLHRLSLKTCMTIRFNVSRRTLDDFTAHAILCIVRELVGNAIRHGHATRIRIVGIQRGNALSFSVRDNGCGFDPTHVPGVAEGHFGLEGIRTRLQSLNGTLRLSSAPGKGSRVVVPCTLFVRYAHA